MSYRELMRRKLLEEMYDKLSDEDKRLFVQLTMQDKSHEEILSALNKQESELRDIRKAQSWWLDLSSNVAGNALFDGATWILSRFFRKF